MAHIECDNDVIFVNTAWTEEELVKSLPGARWNANSKLWTMPRTWASCVQLRASFGDALVIGPELNAWAQNELATRIQPANNVRSSLDFVSGFHPDLYAFQTAGVSFLKLSQGGILADEMGLGKTAQILCLIESLTKDDPTSALPALVICPNSVKTGWRQQAEKWKTPANVYIVEGSATVRRKILKDALTDPTALVVINLEAMRQFSRLAPYGSVRLARCRSCDKRRGEETLTPTKCEVHAKELNSFNFKTVVLDEAHRIKDPTSKQTRAVWAVGHSPSVQHRYALTGTPIANHVGDLWAILHFIAPKEHPTNTKYIERYALQAWNAFGGLDIVGIKPNMMDEFYKIFDPRFRRTPKAVVANQLPPVIRIPRYVRMTPKQATAYQEMSRRLRTSLENGDILYSGNHLVNSIRLLQVASSYVKTELIEQIRKPAAQCCPGVEDDDTKHGDLCDYRYKLKVTLIDPSPKLDAMMEAYDDLGGKPVVIAAASRQLIDLAAKRFADKKIPYGLITGVVPDWERQMVIHNFKNGHINVVLMTISAGGTGIDGLQHSDTMFVLQRSWSLIQNLQLDGRIHRFGAEVHDTTTIIDFITSDTIEETRLYPTLMRKYELLEQINRDKARILESGGTPDAMYSLDQAEQRELQGNLLSNMHDISMTPDEEI